jgi:hypothetical protein
MHTTMRNKIRFITFIILFLASLLFFPVNHPDQIIGKGNLDAAIFHEYQVQAQTPQTAYVATNLEDCGTFEPCYINTDGIDGPNGAGTGLRDAVTAPEDYDEIIILKSYLIKDHTVLIDKNIVIQGLENATISYDGSDCSSPMLSFTAGGTLKNLTIDGGDCDGISRDLVTIDSPVNVRVEHNTLTGGGRAININRNDGKISVAFNQLTENQDYALYQGTEAGTGTVEIYANNIYDNRVGAQVNCNNLGSADHNFWGAGILATAAGENCTVSDGKMLGAPILTDAGLPGVQALQINVTDSFTNAFEDKIKVKRDSGGNYDLVIVNHGQVSEENIPFLDRGATPIVACSNFYDLFLAPGAAASDLVLSLKYDLNDSCVSAVESSDFCGQADSSKFPLWWYDPANALTDGWDRTGQIPQGDNPLNISGQETSCYVDSNELQVVIDGSGRPGISEDIGFTPFLAGLPIGTSDITSFSGLLNVDEVILKWETDLESSISGYYVLRSSVKSGPYNRISPLITSLGSNTIYQFTDELDSSDLNKIFYYKIEIINSFGDTIRTHGPQEILTSTPTPSGTLDKTLTPTRTITLTRTQYPTRTPQPTSTIGPTRTPQATNTLVPTRTATLYLYRSPTSIYRPRTSTPYSTPTQVRTDRPSATVPSPTASHTIQPTITATPVAETASSTVEAGLTPSPSMSPDTTSHFLSQTPIPSRTPTDQATTIPTVPNDAKPGGAGRNQWAYLLLGMSSGLGILGLASFLLSKSFFH